jgi:two-component system response regulator DctR
MTGYVAARPGSPLSRREKQVCSLMTLGLSNKEISKELGISYRTVEDHRRTIFVKMQCRNAVELTRKVVLDGVLLC